MKMIGKMSAKWLPNCLNVPQCANPFCVVTTKIARFMGPTWADGAHLGAPWTLLSGQVNSANWKMVDDRYISIWQGVVLQQPAPYLCDKLGFNTLRPRRKWPDNISKCISLDENVLISIKMSLKFVPKGPMGPLWPLGTNFSEILIEIHTF